MLPDVWRMADRRARVRDVDPAVAQGVVRAVAEGIAHHVAVDAWFHGAPVFARGESAAREALRRAVGAAKIGLFAHVTWELCLDGALLRRQGVERVLDAVRGSVAAVRPDAHHRAAALYAWPNDAGGRVDRGGFDARVDEILDAIARGPWIAGYATGFGVVERLEGVRGRLGFSRFEAADRGAIVEGLDALAGRADEAVDEVLSSNRVGRWLAG